MNSIFPVELQDLPNMEYTQRIIDGVVRTGTDTGISQSRPRYTRTRMMAAVSIWVDANLYKIFMDFYNLNLAQGTLPFRWVDPITNATKDYKFNSSPNIQYVGPLNWQISFEMEEI
jgi:hypothetical protein